MAQSSKFRSKMYLWALLSAATMVQVLTMPTKAPSLVIVSSVPLGRPIFDENFGPFHSHQDLTLTCTIENTHDVSLSWWEDGVELDSVTKRLGDISGCSLTLQDVTVTDSGRRFTCRDKDTGLTMDAVLDVVDPQLVITSSVQLGTPIFDEKIGPIRAHQDLTLTCTIEIAHHDSLSWWEEGTELESVNREVDGISGSSLTLQNLNVADSGRRFTCRDKDTGNTRDAVIEISDPSLMITSSIDLGRPIFDENIGPIRAHQQLTLTCTIEMHSDVPLSWWEDGVELDSVTKRVGDISGCSLTLQDLTVTDSGRRFTCRDKDTGLTKDAVLDVFEDMGPSQLSVLLIYALIGVIFLALLPVFVVIAVICHSRGRKLIPVSVSSADNKRMSQSPLMDG